MLAQFTPMHQLAYTLSLTESPYSKYFKSVAIWDTTFQEEEEFLKEVVQEDLILSRLHKISMGLGKSSQNFENQLRINYLVHIVDDYGSSYKFIKSYLFFLLGYDLDKQETIFERSEKYTNQLRFPTFFLDTLVEKERFDSYLPTPNMTPLELISLKLQNNDIKGSLHIVKFLNSIMQNRKRYATTHYNSKDNNNTLYEDYRPQDSLTDLKGLYEVIRLATGQQLPHEVAREILNLQLCDLQEMFKQHDSNNIATGLLTGNPTHLVTLIDFVLIIGAIPSQE